MDALFTAVSAVSVTGLTVVSGAIRCYVPRWYDRVDYYAICS